MKLERWRTLLALSIMCCMLCSGCITGNSNGETAPPTTTVAPTTHPPTTVVPTTFPPMTVPPNVNTTPIYASELQAEFAEEKVGYEERGEAVQQMFDALQAMAQDPDLDYEEFRSAFEQYEAEWRAYRTALCNYYYHLILLEHVTTARWGDLLLLKKDTLPFGRPNGKTYSYGVLNMAGENMMHITNMIESYIEDGIAGQDSRQDIVDWLDTLENYLPEYYDMEIGYTYRHLSYYLFNMSLYSNILIRG